MNIHLRFSKHCWQYPILVTLHEKARSSRPEVFCKKGVFENFANQRCFPVNFAKFSRTPFFIEHLRWLLLKAKSRSSCLEVFCKKRCFWKFRKPKVFSCEFCNIFKNTFFHRTPPVAASEKLKAEAVIRRCSVKKVFLKISQAKGVFLWILRNFQEHLFLKSASGGYFWKAKSRSSRPDVFC